MALPEKYLDTLQPVVASYNFADVDEGTGITKYYGFTSEQSTGEVYNLTTQQPYSYRVNVSGSLGTNVAFSGSFNTGAMSRTRIVKGTAIINMTWRVTNSSGSNNNFPFVELRKYDGSTYTKFAEVSGSIASSASGTFFTTALRIANIPATLIKPGEQVSVNVGICGADAGSSPKGIIACDPQNRDPGVGAGNYATSNLICNIPYQIIGVKG